MDKKSNLSQSSKKSNDKEDQDNNNALSGWSGYRTRAGRSGYDPVDTRTEAGHMPGIFIRELFTGRLKTENPVYLSILLIVGLVLVIPLFFAIIEMQNGNLFSWQVWILFSIAGIIGIAALVNFIKNVNGIARPFG